MRHIEVTTSSGEKLGATLKLFNLLLSAAEPFDPVIELGSKAITHFAEARYGTVPKMHGDVHVLHLLKCPHEVMQHRIDNLRHQTLDQGHLVTIQGRRLNRGIQSYRSPARP